MPKKKIVTNQDFVKRFMKESPINEAFVVTALHFFSNEVLDKQEEIRKEMKNGVISPDLWIQTANTWLTNYNTPVA